MWSEAGLAGSLKTIMCEGALTPRARGPSGCMGRLVGYGAVWFLKVRRLTHRERNALCLPGTKNLRLKELHGFEIFVWNKSQYSHTRNPSSPDKASGSEGNSWKRLRWRHVELRAFTSKLTTCVLVTSSQAIVQILLNSRLCLTMYINSHIWGMASYQRTTQVLLRNPYRCNKSFTVKGVSCLIWLYNFIVNWYLKKAC